MPIVARRALPGEYVDASTPMTPPVLAAVKASGKLGIIRYVPLPGVVSRADISAGELAAIAADGMASWLVQHVRFAGWDPGAHNGANDAQAAVQAAQLAGYPKGGHIFVDLEGMAGTTSAAITFATAWQAVIIAAGYAAGCYVGYQVPMTAAQLYLLHGFNQYWKGWGGTVPTVRGCSVVQGPEVMIGGATFDLDRVGADLLGDLPMVAVNDAAQQVA